MSLLDSIILSIVRAAILVRHRRLSRQYWHFGDGRQIPNPALPRNGTDKFFWRKAFDRNPQFVQVSDKLALRDWLEANGFNVPMPKVLWRGQDAAEIPDAVFKWKTVLKANHGCAMNIFLEGPPENRRELTVRANEFLTRSHAYGTYQWGYFDIPRELFVEEWLETEIADVKIYTFGSKCVRAVTVFDRFAEMKSDVWMKNGQNSGWHRSDSRSAVTEARANKPLPDRFGEMVALAEKIGAHFDHVRVDFLWNGHEFYLGELTHYNMGGHFSGLQPTEEAMVDAAWDLRKSWFMTSKQTGWRKVYADALRRRLDAMERSASRQ